MRRLTFLSMMVTSVLLLGAAVAFAADVSLQPTIDSSVRTNYDEVDNRGYTCRVWPSDDNFAPQVRLAPTGRIDSWRPMPGLIEESTAAIEFDLSSLSASDAGGIASAVVRLTAKEFRPDSGVAYPIDTLFRLGGYEGDGKIAGLTDAAVATQFPNLTSPLPDFAPPGLRPLGTFTVPATLSGDTVYQVSATAFLNDLLLSGRRWAGFNLAMDYSSLPPRESIPNDRTWGVRFYSNNADPAKGPQLLVTPYPMHDLNVTISQYQASGLPAAKAQGLRDKVNAATAAFTRDQPEVTINVLNAFIKNVKSLVKDKYLTKAQGDALIAGAQQIIDDLELVG